MPMNIPPVDDTDLYIAISTCITMDSQTYTMVQNIFTNARVTLLRHDITNRPLSAHPIPLLA